MAKKTYPAWQEVLLLALRCVPKAKDGDEAWSRLNEEEQAGVMVFLGEHCGHDADRAKAMLEETCGLIKPVKRGAWVRGLLEIAIVAVVWWLLYNWLQQYENLDGCLLALVALTHVELEWRAEPAGRMRTIWEEHVNTRNGTSQALADMYRIFNLPRKDRVNKGWLIFWVVILALVLGMQLLTALR